MQTLGEMNREQRQQLVEDMRKEGYRVDEPPAEKCGECYGEGISFWRDLVAGKSLMEMGPCLQGCAPTDMALACLRDVSKRLGVKAYDRLAEIDHPAKAEQERKAYARLCERKGMAVPEAVRVAD